MPEILTTGSQVTCEHKGTVFLKSSQTKLKIDGQPVLLESDLAGSAITGCQNVSATTKACTTVSLVTAGKASGLTVNGTPVLTADASGPTDGTPPAKWSVSSAGQTKLVAS